MKKFIAIVLIISLFVMTTSCSENVIRPVTTTSAVKVRTLKAETDACDGAVYITVTANPQNGRITMIIDNDLGTRMSIWARHTLVDANGIDHGELRCTDTETSPHSKKKVTLLAKSEYLTEGARIEGSIFGTSADNNSFSLVLKESE